MDYGAATFPFKGSMGAAADSSVKTIGTMRYTGLVWCLAEYQTSLKILTLAQP